MKACQSMKSSKVSQPMFLSLIPVSMRSEVFLSGEEKLSTIK